MIPLDAYVARTLRVTAWVTLLVVAILLQSGQWWTIVPFLAGLGLAVVLLLGWNGFVRTVVTPEGEKTLRAERWRRRFLLFALVKYPLVAAFIWYLTRHWEARSLAVFAIGFFLLQAVIALRAVGRALTEHRDGS